MDPNGGAIPLASRTQPTIRSFFQPKAPQYAAAPIPIAPRSSENGVPPTTTRSPPAAIFSQPSNPYTNPIKAAPSQGIVVPIEAHHIQPLRRINTLLLEVNYPDKFYHQILAPAPAHLSRVILWTDLSPAAEQKVIGGITCRLDPSYEPNSTPHPAKSIPNTFDVYIQSLALLSPYRNKGLAAQGLDSIVQAAVTQRAIRIRSLYAHVWTENTYGLEWYIKRGFVKDGDAIKGYYMKLKPDTAWLLRKTLGPTHYLAHGTSAPSEGIPSAIEEGAGNSTTLGNAKSFQDRRPEVEWNDLPEDVLGNTLLKAPSAPGSRAVSAASSRSSSRSGIDKKEKKKRQYPAAAFGS